MSGVSYYLCTDHDTCMWVDGAEEQGNILYHFPTWLHYIHEKFQDFCGGSTITSGAIGSEIYSSK